MDNPLVSFVIFRIDFWLTNFLNDFEEKII